MESHFPSLDLRVVQREGMVAVGLLPCAHGEVQPRHTTSKTHVEGGDDREAPAR